MKRFNEKLVVLSGAAAGIGYSTALRLADEGANLIVIDYDANGIKALKKKLNSSIFETYVHDISDEEGTKKIFEEICDRYVSIDALINVAGILGFDHSKDVKMQDWKKIIDTNLTGTFFMCRYALPMLLISKGNIVNVSSTAALGSHAWTAAYSASKGGISAFSKTLAVEYGVLGLNVNCICPASIKTKMSTETPLPDGFDKRLLKKIMPVDGINRSPDDVASAIAFLASEDAVHINGINLRVDGGLLS